MFDMVVRLGDRLGTLVDGLDPDAVSGSAAGELWAALDRVERLAAAGKTLLARRVADNHVPDRAGVKTAAEDLARRGGTTVGAARNALDTSTRLPQLARVQAALRRGDLSPAQAADALLALAEAATGADGSAATQTDSEASTDVAASKAAAEVATDVGSSADGAQQPALTPARRPPRRPNPRYLALLRVDLAALRRGGVADGELCEITGVGPVPVPVARNLLGESVLKLVITRGVDVAHITHLGRGPSAAQRIALAWTSPGCTVAGCPRNRIEYDHREDWARTRRTRLNQLDPLCEHHHDLKTRHHWALVTGHGKRPIVPPHDPRHPRHHQARTDRGTGGRARRRVSVPRHAPPAAPAQSAPPSEPSTNPPRPP